VVLTTAVAVCQMVVTVVVAVALVLSFRQLCYIQRQTDLSRSGQLAQGTMEVVKFLTTPELKSAEQHVDRLMVKSRSEWDDKDRAMLTTCCNAFDLAGIFIRAGLADEKLIVDNWGARIRVLYELASAHIQESRARFATPLYWDDFEWLASRRSAQVVNEQEFVTGTGRPVAQGGQGL
jgi:hypothetical protein